MDIITYITLTHTNKKEKNNKKKEKYDFISFFFKIITDNAMQIIIYYLKYDICVQKFLKKKRTQIFFQIS